MPPSLSDSESNMLPILASRPRSERAKAKQLCARGRIALSGGCLRSPRTGRRIGHSRLFRERAERMGGACKVKKNRANIKPVSAAYGRAGDALGSAGLEIGTGGAMHAKTMHPKTIQAKIWSLPVLVACLLFSTQVSAASAGLPQSPDQLRGAVRARRQHRCAGPAGWPAALRAAGQAVRDRESTGRRHAHGGAAGRQEPRPMATPS